MKNQTPPPPHFCIVGAPSVGCSGAAEQDSKGERETIEQERGGERERLVKHEAFCARWCGGGALLPAGERVHDCAVSVRRLKRGESKAHPFRAAYEPQRAVPIHAHTPHPST